MVRSIANIRQYLLHLTTINVASLSTEQEISLKAENNICIFEFLEKEDFLDNEFVVNALIKNYHIPCINAMTENVTALHYEKINEYFKEGYFIFKNTEGIESYAVNNLSVIKEKKLDTKNDIKIYLVKHQDLLKILEREFSQSNTYWAINHLGSISPNASAKNINYTQMITGSAVIFFSTLILFFNVFSMINNFAYLLQNFLKAILFKRSLVGAKKSSIASINDDMPIYSVLIPLYKEELKVQSILQAIKNLNYPKDRLDVKFIIEADDLLTMKAIKVLSLPSYIHIIKVPYSLPRTKPKALNYAMAYVRGEFLTIYDAEDRPDPDQLLKALHAFNTLPEHFACVQAKLNFYNAQENLLTRFFSIEYSVWFEYLLKGLSLLDLPVTLGGTSNHFKIDKLKKVGYWDAYNVTEDADLGIRLYLNGYKVHLIDSTTMEEAPTNMETWIAQRARWIKGFIQTLYIFMRAKKSQSSQSVFLCKC